jgi:hypothetical protein
MRIGVSQKYYVIYFRAFSNTAGAPDPSAEQMPKHLVPPIEA